ncbi:MAG: DinB family protein [Bacteroidia bacterium]|nr:DinB family protein [Bacteroidia bacterium]
MTANIESKTLANTLNNARQLTQFYLHHTKDVDVEKQFSIDNFTTNNIHLVCHLAWAENFLILNGVGGKGIKKEWLQNFQIGSDYPDASKFPAYSESLETFDEIHKQSLELLNNLPDKELDNKNNVGLQFSIGDSKRIIINHCIRHEGVHCGHLGWLLRMHGKKII